MRFCLYYCRFYLGGNIFVIVGLAVDIDDLFTRLKKI